MNNEDILQLVMIGILMLCGYIYLLQSVAKRTENKSRFPVIAVILFFIYAIIAVPLLLIFRQLGSTSMILMALLLLFSCVVLFAAVYGLIHHFREINKGMLALLIIYIFAVAYITVFSRKEVRGASSGRGGIYLFRFDLIQEAVRTRSLEPVNHLLLNIGLFVPLGFLLPLVCPERLSKLSYVLLAGLLFTTVIEVMQMMLRLGQADLTDMVTNTLGCLIGYGLYRIFRHFHSDEES